MTLCINVMLFVFLYTKCNKCNLNVTTGGLTLWIEVICDYLKQIKRYCQNKQAESENGHSKYLIVLLEHLVLTLSSLHVFSNTYLCNNQMLSIPAALVNFL